jgi:hypothetical protein
MGLRGAAPSAGLRWRFVMSHPSRAGACERCSVYTLTGDACAVAPAALRGAALGADGRAAYVFRLRLIVRIRIQLRRGTAHSWRSLIRARGATFLLNLAPGLAGACPCPTIHAHMLAKGAPSLFLMFFDRVIE